LNIVDSIEKIKNYSKNYSDADSFNEDTKYLKILAIFWSKARK
jgi:hypothetical protein